MKRYLNLAEQISGCNLAMLLILVAQCHLAHII
ncbi:Uncharacterised protein [Vibrio cholerae]|nr:Uncharacterised protein [Vibrio cholerae]